MMRNRRVLKGDEFLKKIEITQEVLFPEDRKHKSQPEEEPAQQHDTPEGDVIVAEVVED